MATHRPHTHTQILREKVKKRERPELFGGRENFHTSDIKGRKWCFPANGSGRTQGWGRPKYTRAGLGYPSEGPVPEKPAHSAGKQASLSQEGGPSMANTWKGLSNWPRKAATKQTLVYKRHPDSGSTQLQRQTHKHTTHTHTERHNHRYTRVAPKVSHRRTERHNGYIFRA